MSKNKQSTARIRALPWALMLRGVVVVGQRWAALSSKDRARLTTLVRDSRGRLSNLSTREREDLRRLVGKLDLKGAAGELLPLMRGGKRKRR